MNDAYQWHCKWQWLIQRRRQLLHHWKRHCHWHLIQSHDFPCGFWLRLEPHFSSNPEATFPSLVWEEQLFFYLIVNFFQFVEFTKTVNANIHVTFSSEFLQLLNCHVPDFTNCFFTRKRVCQDISVWFLRQNAQTHAAMGMNHWGLPEMEWWG